MNVKEYLKSTLPFMFVDLAIAIPICLLLAVALGGSLTWQIVGFIYLVVIILFLFCILAVGILIYLEERFKK